MADFTTSGSVRIEVDQSSLRDARDEIESEIGSVSVGVDGGVATARTDGGGGRQRRRTRQMWQASQTQADELTTQTGLLEDVVDILEDDDGPGGGGGGGGGGGLLGGDFSSAITGGLAARGLGGLGGAAGLASLGTAGTVGLLGLGGLGAVNIMRALGAGSSNTVEGTNDTNNPAGTPVGSVEEMREALNDRTGPAQMDAQDPPFIEPTASPDPSGGVLSTVFGSQSTNETNDPTNTPIGDVGAMREALSDSRTSSGGTLGAQDPPFMSPGGTDTGGIFSDIGSGSGGGGGGDVTVSINAPITVEQSPELQQQIDRELQQLQDRILREVAGSDTAGDLAQIQQSNFQTRF